MGAGHDGAARELARRLADAGHDVEVRDLLLSGPLSIGNALRRGYEWELKHLPSAYDATYRFWRRAPWLCPVVAWLVAGLAHRRLLRWVKEKEADVVVSTYPLATLALGRLRRQGRLHVPVVNFITDFGVHPLWVHKGVDLNLAVHEGPADMAAARTGRPSIACGPVVSEAFRPATPEERSLARARFGLGPYDRAVLIVAGSWGVGGVAETLQAIADSRYVPVVVCGRDANLHQRLRVEAAKLGARAIVLGWTDRMPSVMSACDALVENAGGLTSLEAFRAGLPVVSFQPIAGHGKENTTAMAGAGVSRLADDADDLIDILDIVTCDGPARQAQVTRAAAMFAEDAAGLVLAVAGDTRLLPCPVAANYRPAAAWRRPARVAGRVGAATAMLAGLAWAGLTTGVDMAAAEGVGVAHPAADAGPVVFFGVRLTAEELADPQIAAQIENLGASAVVDEHTALADPSAVRALARGGVDVENGGRGAWRSEDGNLSRPALWNRAQDDTKAGSLLSEMIGQPVRVFVPGRRVNAFDLMDCSHAHVALVVPDTVVTASDPDLVAPAVRRIYVFSGLGATPQQLAALLVSERGALVERGLSGAPLSALQ